MPRSLAFPLARALACVALLAAPATFAAPAPEPAVPPLQLPEPVSRTLPNGLRVAVFPSHALPVVQAQLLVRAGVADEPDSLPGLAALTAMVVQLGSASRTAAQLAADLASIGATFTTSAQRDYTLAALGARASVFEAGLEILADAAIGPRLGHEEVESAKRLVFDQLRARGRSEAALADDRLWGITFDPHPYGHPDRGDPEALLSADLDHVRAFVRDRWRPDRAVLAIAGDVDPERAFQAVERVFGRWGGTTAPDRERPAPGTSAGLHVLDLAGSPRAEVRVAVRGPGRASPEMAAWLVATAALEERLAGTAATATFTPLRDASLLVLAESGPADSAAAVTKRLLAALRGVASGAPAGDAARALRRRVAQALPLSLETMGARLSRWQADDFANLPPDAVARLRATLLAPALDLAPATRALAARPAVLVAGPGARVRTLLAPLGDVVDVPFSAWRASRPDTLPAPTEEQLAAGRKAVEAAVAAHGGAARLAGAKVLVSEGTMRIESRGQQVDGQFSIVRAEPDRLSQSTKMLTFEVRQVLDGDQGWMLSLGDSASLAEADSAEVRALQAAFHSDFVHVLRAAAAPGSGAALRGRETIREADCDLVDFTGHGGQRLRLAIDRAGGQVMGVDAGLGGDLKWHDRRLFSEWKTVLGLVLPAYEERFLDGERVNYFRARALSVNAELDEGLFRKPMIVRGQIIPGR